MCDVLTGEDLPAHLQRELQQYSLQHIVLKLEFRVWKRRFNGCLWKLVFLLENGIFGQWNKL